MTPNQVIAAFAVALVVAVILFYLRTQKSRGCANILGPNTIAPRRKLGTLARRPYWRIEKSA